MLRWMPRATFVVMATLATSGVASAQPSPAATSSTGQPPKPVAQGIAVLAVGDAARDDAFALARAIYGSRLRPTQLDEVRARVLAGDAPPANGSRELRELAELRAGVTGENAAGRRLLTGLAQQVGAQALLVVKVERKAPAPGPPPDPGKEWPSFEAPNPDAGLLPGNTAGPTTVVVRLFLSDSGEFDAARYAPEPGLTGAAAWKGTLASLEARFPLVSRTVGPNDATRATPPAMRPEDDKSSPFYTSGWFWGSVGAAALLGAAFYFATRDTSSDTIHLQIRTPR